MSYEFDVFLSYPRNPDLNAWIDEYFIPRLHLALQNETLGVCNRRMGKFFFDVSGTEEALQRSRDYACGIKPGQVWQQELERALGVSRCMVALWSNTYFDSHWCKTELESFLSRQPAATVPIVIPVSVIKREKLPAAVLSKYQIVDMYNYVVDGPSFIKSELFPPFLKEIRRLAEMIAESICKAPEYQAWPITRPADTPASPPVVVSNFVRN